MMKKIILSFFTLLFISSSLLANGCITQFSIAWANAQDQYIKDQSACPVDTIHIGDSVLLEPQLGCYIDSVNAFEDKMNQAVQDYNCCEDGDC